MFHRENLSLAFARVRSSTRGLSKRDVIDGAERPPASKRDVPDGAKRHRRQRREQDVARNERETLVRRTRRGTSRILWVMGTNNVANHAERNENDVVKNGAKRYENDVVKNGANKQRER
jgi:hypothetical protein